MTERRIILIRAVNVGGTAKLPMASLRSLAQDLGAGDVATYIQSGNLVCTIDGDAGAFDRSLEAAIESEHGFFREVISRSPAELARALAAYPFDDTEPRYCYVTLLSGAPSASAIAAAAEIATGDDEWAVVGSEMYVRYANGAGRPQMKDAAIGRALGVAGTARNLNTVRKLIDLA